MEKSIVSLLFFLGCNLLYPNTACCQKFDNVWVFGYNWDSDLESETYRLVFDTFPPRLVEYPGEVSIDLAYASICDSAGALDLYTNNCFIADGNGDIIEEGDTLTDGFDLGWCQTYRWFPFSMSNLFIPSPENSNHIYSFSKSTYYVTDPSLIVFQDKVKYTVVDLSKNNGLGKVVEKGQTILTNRFGYGQLTAVKHGNGRDWWLPLPVELGNEIIFALFDADTVAVHHAQKMGPVWGDAASFQAIFSLDGSMYARYNRFYGLYLYDFDRCDGLLSNLRYFPFIDTTNSGLFGSVAFSPDNHYLYFPINYDSLCQMDLKAPDLAASVKVVATWDGSTEGGVLGTKFGNMVNGPDGRLYIIPPAYSTSMNVINRPNVGGLSCDVQQHIFNFPNYYGNPPNFPNYRLGSLDGSPCDTLGIDNLPLAGFRPDPADTNGLSMQFWDVSAYAPATWHWDFGDGATSQDTSPAHTYAAPGFYTVCQTVSNAYGSDSHCKIVHIQTVGTSDAGPDEVLEIYPNPTTGLVYLPWRDAPAGRVRVHDLTGRLVQDMEVQGPEINLGALPDGLYVLTVQERETGRRWVGKVLVLK